MFSWRISIVKLKLFLFLLVLFVTFQATEVKFMNVKISELFMLLIAPVLLIQSAKINKYLFLLFCLFVSFIIITFIGNYQREFFLDLTLYNIIKHPYYITISRFLEILSCLVFVLFCTRSFNYFASKGYSIEKILSLFFRVNSYIGVVYILFYILISFDLITYLDTPFFHRYDGAPRLRALYVEGGPLGLMYAFLFAISITISHKKKFDILILIILVFISVSKAGIMLLILWSLYLLITHFKKDLTNIAIAGFVFIIVGIISGVIMSNRYMNEFKIMNEKLITHGNDPNFALGRIPALSYIVPNMIKHNPIMGVGLGNYSLTRNAPIYREVFPYFEDWDLTGLGGIVTMMAENGLLGTACFLAIILFLYANRLKVSKVNARLCILFIVTLLFGVQLTFIYVWLSLALSLVKFNSPSNLIFHNKI